MTLAELNSASEADFVNALGGVFEHSPWVARRVAAQRPFTSVAALHDAMVGALGRAAGERQLELIRAHPDLAGKAARAGTLTADSEREQAGAGLDRLSEAEYERFHTLNEAYREKFDFPFIIAVKGRDKQSILEAFEFRLRNSQEAEKRRALDEIAQIVRFRLDDLIRG